MTTGAPSLLHHVLDRLADKMKELDEQHGEVRITFENDEQWTLSLTLHELEPDDARRTASRN